VIKTEPSKIRTKPLLTSKEPAPKAFARVIQSACQPACVRDPGKVRAMPLIQVVLVLIVVGVLLWLINRFIPMAGSIKSILNAVVVIAVVLWLLNIFGLWDYASHVRVGR
jgi:hypothetical protein